MHYALRIQADYESVLFENHCEIIGEILNSLIASPYFMDIKLTILLENMEKIQYSSVETLITYLQRIVVESQEPDGVLVCNINPIAVSIQLM